MDMAAAFSFNLCRVFSRSKAQPKVCAAKRPATYEEARFCLRVDKVLATYDHFPRFNLGRVGLSFGFHEADANPYKALAEVNPSDFEGLHCGYQVADGVLIVYLDGRFALAMPHEVDLQGVTQVRPHR